MGVSFKLDDIGGTSTAKAKEHNVLLDSSLTVLSRVLGHECGIRFAMLLNIPTTRIMKLIFEQNPECGLLGASDKVVVETTQNLLLHWKQMKASCKDKEKLNDLKRALEALGKEKEDMRKVVEDKIADNEELKAEFFAD